MNTVPPLHTPELLAGPRFALERRVCVVANRWGARRAVGLFFSGVSRLGDGMFWYALMVVLALTEGLNGFTTAVHMAITGVVGLLSYRLLKRWTRRPRPYRACPGVTAHVPPLDEFSFPSGHTLQAVSFSIVAVAAYPVLAPWLLSFTALIAASRVILGLHYPSDVLAAIAIGGVLGSTSLWMAHGLRPLI